MTAPYKRRMKRFVAKYEIAWYVVTGLLFLASVFMLLWAVPVISNLVIAIIQLVTGFTATVAAAASAIKSEDNDR